MLFSLFQRFRHVKKAVSSCSGERRMKRGFCAYIEPNFRLAHVKLPPGEGVFVKFMRV